jgi:hypothetical protein
MLKIQIVQTFLGLVTAKSDVLFIAVYPLPKYIGKLIFSDGLASITTCPKVVLGQGKVSQLQFYSSEQKKFAGQSRVANCLDAFGTI